MYEASVILTVLLMIVAAIDYVRRTWIQETKPVLATWILIVFTMGLSCWMYWNNPQKSWTANIGVISALVNTSIILMGVIAANIRYSTLKVAFDKTQILCLVGGVGIFIMWLITKQPLISYVLVQLIALIGYFATMKRLQKAKSSTEPLFVWISVLLASLCAIYPAYVKNDIFAWIFLARAIPLTAIMIYLIARIKHKARG